MCSQINTATWKRLPVIGKSIKGKKYYGTTRFEGNYRLSFR